MRQSVTKPVAGRYIVQQGVTETEDVATINPVTLFYDRERYPDLQSIYDDLKARYGERWKDEWQRILSQS